MLTEFHFIRPLWFLAFFPLLFVVYRFFRKTTKASAWNMVCDEHLLPYLIERHVHKGQYLIPGMFFLSIVFLIVSLAGPAWTRLPVQTYQKIEPRLVVLDMSDAMLIRDLPPDRLARAKFKLHDLFQHQGVGQYGMVVFTGEPFVVSPLTDDGLTIDSLLSSLTPDVMPVEGHELGAALKEAGRLITAPGFNHGQILVLTATAPSEGAIDEAKNLVKQGIITSIMPVVSEGTPLGEDFKRLAQAGAGRVIQYRDSSKDIEEWLSISQRRQQFINSKQAFSVWREEGRWLLIPALLCLIPSFRRGWL
jgi:Ca-activated chloride channel family protein